MYTLNDVRPFEIFTLGLRSGGWDDGASCSSREGDRDSSDLASGTAGTYKHFLQLDRVRVMELGGKVGGWKRRSR